MKKLIKCLVFGFVAVGFVACDSISGVFDKFSYDEVFEAASKNMWEMCSFRNEYVDGIKDCKCIPPSELADEEKGLIGACEYTKKAGWNLELGYKNDELKKECKTGQSEGYTGANKIDEKSGAWLIENKYKVITIVESAEYSENKDGQGLCKKREIYKLKRGQPKK